MFEFGCTLLYRGQIITTDCTPWQYICITRLQSRNLCQQAKCMISRKIGYQSTLNTFVRNRKACGCFVFAKRRLKTRESTDTGIFFYVNTRAFRIYCMKLKLQKYPSDIRWSLYWRWIFVEGNIIYADLFDISWLIWKWIRMIHIGVSDISPEVSVKLLLNIPQ